MIVLFSHKKCIYLYLLLNSFHTPTQTTDSYQNCTKLQIHKKVSSFLVRNSYRVME